MSKLLVSYAALGYLNIQDGLLTIAHLRQGGIELNPLIATIIADFGFSGMMIFKLIMLLLIGGVLIAICKYQPKYHANCIRMMNVAVAFFLLLNLYSIIVLP